MLDDGAFSDEHRAADEWLADQTPMHRGFQAKLR
jgi:hypothetical protein